MTEDPGKPDFLEELKRRKTIRAAVVYLAAAWAGIEVSEVALPLFGAPESALRIVVVMAALGLPLTLVLAWLFDLTPEGLRRAAPATGLGNAVPDVPWMSLRTGLVVIGLVGLSLTVGWWLGGSGLPEPATWAPA